MPPTAQGPRVLLRQLREVMAEQDKAQNRLNRITEIIAANVVAEVCSIYVLRSDEMLELYATKGLKPSAVHRTRMKIGEGLVGTIAATSKLLNLSNAQSHAAFKFLPETGEEIFHSFLGVPILRNGVTAGVLVVQNETLRKYTPEEEEALQTTAMVLAEIIASGELDDNGKIKTALNQPLYLKGEPLVAGIALGQVVLHEPRVVVTDFVARDIGEEQQRLIQALGQLRVQVDKLVMTADIARMVDYSDVLETYRMFAHDQGWARRIEAIIATGLTAEAAVERIQNETRARMLKAPDPYLRERLHDLDDLANRLLRILTGTAETAAREDLPENSIIIAHNMGPAELLDYDRDKIRGVIFEEAGASSHVAIVARALDIPTVCQLENIVDLVETGDDIIVDGARGDVQIRPSAEIKEAYEHKVRFQARKQARFARLRNVEPITSDGRRISLNVNAGLLIDLPHLDESGADGIGLFRTELQFMLSRTLPGRQEQQRLYKSVMQAAGKRPVVFRTLDIGTDKMLPYLKSAREENPAMGWRGIRMSMERPAFMKLQVRAFLRAASGRSLHLMFPMIAEIDEFTEARKLVLSEYRMLQKNGKPVPDKIHIGAMIEVPSLLWQLDHLVEEADFLSIGSNDLIQYLFASDRGNPKLNKYYDTLSPIMLRLLRDIVQRCRAASVPLTLCGEMASDPLEAMALVGIGFDSISMAPASVGPVKSMILKLDQSHLARFMKPLLDTPVKSLRPQLQAYADGRKLLV